MTRMPMTDSASTSSVDCAEAATTVESPYYELPSIARAVRDGHFREAMMMAYWRLP